MRIKTMCNNCTVVLIDGHKNYLFSYNLLVAVYNYRTEKLYVCDNNYSPTTSRHFNKWCKYYSINAEKIGVSRSKIEAI